MAATNLDTTVVCICKHAYSAYVDECIHESLCIDTTRQASAYENMHLCYVYICTHTDLHAFMHA